MSRSVLIEQIKSPLRGDWINLVIQDLHDLEIKLSFGQIESLTKSKFKMLVKNSCKIACFNSLMKDKEKLSKGKEIKYDRLESQTYLNPGNNLLLETMRWIFRIRSRDLDIKGNYPNCYSDVTCVISERNERETQLHFWECQKYRMNHEVSETNVSYSDIFTSDTRKQGTIMKIMKQKYEERKSYF